ncbi:hypothetical protein [Methylobacterium planeticum]|uniref:hypothetical protein n=1 Tax=Methylobacterium planeticum TaxID=2615211 RepID=UPI00178477FD|nr:hypothetical protein [Methylobacterium planeticum]
MAAVTRSVLRWTPSAEAVSTEHLTSEGLKILAFGMVAALVVYGLWSRSGRDWSQGNRA